MRASDFSFKHGGVALADILANSVAVIIILIIISLNVQQQQAQDELEKNADVTSLLARQLSSSVVFNDLPSSPPARLHDYNSCIITHDCNPTEAPIIELHNGYMRIFNVNTNMYRNELLRENNAFDRYINTLSDIEKQKIRIDIHSVSEYYVVLAILREHNIRPRHWHYLGEHLPPLKNNILNSEKTFGNQQADNNTQDEAEKQNNNNYKGETLNEKQGEGQAQQITQILQYTNLADANTMQELNYDSLLPPTQQSSGLSQEEIQNIANSDIPDIQKYLSLYYNQAIYTEDDYQKAIQKGVGKTPGERSMKIHIPNIDTKNQTNNNEENEEITLKAQEYNIVVLSYLFKLLEIAEKQKTLNITNADTLIRYFASKQINLEKLSYYPLVKLIAKALDEQKNPAYTPLSAIVNKANSNNNKLLLKTNSPMPKIILQTHQFTPWVEPLIKLNEIKPSLLMRLYPSLFKGEVLDIPKGYTILLHPEQWQNQEIRWRPIAVLDAKLEDISLGFVYSSLDGNKLAIDSGANQLRLNKIPIANPLISSQDNSQSLMPLIWFIALIVLLMLLFRYHIKKSN